MGDHRVIRRPTTSAEQPGHMPLSELADLFTGYRLYRTQAASGATVPIITVKNVGHELEPAWRLGTAEVPDVGRLERFRVRSGDLLVTARGTSLKSALVPERWHGALVDAN